MKTFMVELRDLWSGRTREDMLLRVGEIVAVNFEFTEEKCECAGIH